MTKVKVQNVYNKPLQPHTTTSDGSSPSSTSDQPTTGYLRDGYCDAPQEDSGNHSVAGIVTDDFLDFTASKGNDLRKQVPGLKGGMKWCLCAHRWKEAFDAAQGQVGDARVPKVRLDATHVRALDVVGFKDLKAFAAEHEASHPGSRPQEPGSRGGLMVKEHKEIGGDQRAS